MGGLRGIVWDMGLAKGVAEEVMTREVSVMSVRVGERDPRGPVGVKASRYRVREGAWSAFMWDIMRAFVGSEEGEEAIVAGEIWVSEARALEDK